jgi:hypothetical protein
MADLTLNQVCNICCIHYNAGLRCCALGSLVEGGYLFAKDGSIAWIVACASREVSRVWASIGDAVTVAQAGNACGDWFVPSRTDLQLGRDCKSFWNSSSSAAYWSSTESSATNAWQVNFIINDFDSGAPKTYLRCVRAFRRVLY